MPPGDQATKPLLEVRKVTKFFGDLAALKEVTLDIRCGESTLLYGPNGAGKTTLLRMLASLVRPSSGQVLFDGKNIEHDGAGAKGAIGFVSHATFLYGELTVRENLKFFGSLFRLSNLEKRIDTALEMFDMRPREDVFARDLSRGLQQRASLARAFLHDPDFVILDEPFTGLDHQSVKKLEDLLLRLPEQGKALMFSTHDFEQGAALATRLIALKAGRVRYNGPLDIAPFKRLGIVRAFGQSRDE
ncbi:MAG: heme ABC exporter ATP-binding protein CcmA [Acidobacteria bacterium]|nr:MAG: heme ABC exporter ATP-binding protein CcmA [Acidobacteriota bacterium]